MSLVPAPLRALVLAAAALAQTVACAPAGSPPPTADRSAQPWRDRDWRLATLAGAPAIVAGGPDTAFLRFDSADTRVVGSTGCNRLSGDYQADGATLTFGPLVTTKRACVDPARQRQEQRLLEAMQQTTAFSVRADTLALRRDAATLATFVAAPPGAP